MSAARTLASLALVLLALATALPVTRAMCAMPEARATWLTDLEHAIPREGALFLGVAVGYGLTGIPAHDDGRGGYALPSAALVQGETRIPLVVRNLRAGLVRLEPASPPADGEHVLEVEGVPPRTITIGGVLPPPPIAPSVTGVEHVERTRTSEGHRGEQRITTWRTEAHLAHALPPDVALVALRPAGRPGAYIVFEGTVAGRQVLRASGTLGGHCGVGLPSGRGRAWHGMRGELVAFDRFGRPSPASAPFTVR